MNMSQQAIHAQNGDYIAWPYSASTQWATQFYAPAKAREDTLVYVHILDRWGNMYANILQRNLQDNEKPTGSSPARGQVTINETGGSGIKEIKITEFAGYGSGSMLPSLEGMTGEMTWDATQNSFTVSGLPRNDRIYSVYFCDNAGHSQTLNFQPTTDNKVTITVNDEVMGGQYAQAAAAPAASGSGSSPAVGAITEDPLTTLAVAEVPIGEIAADTLVGEAPAAPTEQEEEELPDVYSFKLNEVYTVNLFNPTQTAHDVTLKSTAGGIIKTYVDGTYAPAKGGKVTIPGGAQVQIRVAARTGYELESLTMIYANGTVENLVGTYNAEIREDVTIKAVFAETSDTVTVTVENGAINGQTERTVKPYSQITAVAAEAPEGKVFAYWTQNGQDDIPVSYDAEYTFLATSDTALKAVYADAAVEKTAGVVMDAANSSHIHVVNGMYTLSYTGRLIVPEGAQIEEFGMVLINQSAADCTEDTLVIGGTVNGVRTAKLTGSVLTEDGQCKMNVNNVAGGQTRTGRLYLVVKLADGTTQTLYSSTWSELQTPAE